MKTLNEIAQEIDSIISENTKQQDNSIKNAARKKLKKLNLVKKILEYPQCCELSILRQKTEVEGYLKIQNDRYLDWFNKDKNNQTYEPVKKYNKIFEINTDEIKKWKSELSILNYILQD